MVTSKKVLLIEDSKIDQMAFKRMVKQETLPYDYTIASSVAEAKEILASQIFEIVISDHQLGDGTAFDILSLKINSPIIYTTGSGNEEIAVKAMKMGAYDYLVKDPELKYLKVLPLVIENALKHRQAEAEIQQLNTNLERRAVEVEAINQKLKTEIVGHKIAKAALQKSAEEVLDLYNNAPCGYHSLDADGNFLTINDTELTWLGYTREEVIGKLKFTDLLTAESLSIFQEKFSQFKQQGWVHELDFQLLRKDGTILPVLLSATAIKDNDGNFIKSRSTVFDITDRKHTEELLRQSEERFRTAFDYAAIGMALVSTTGQWLQVNPALCEITGYSESELLAKYFQDITHPEDLDKDLNYVQQMLVGEVRTYQLEKRYIHKQGNIVWVLLSVSLVRDIHLQPLYFVSQIQDITKRKQTEEALRKLSRQNESILNCAGEGIIGLDTQANITFANPAAAKMTGYEVTELIGHSLRQKLHHSQADGTAIDVQNSSIQKVFNSGEICHHTKEVFWNKEGSSFPVEYVITPILEELADCDHRQLSSLPQTAYNNPNTCSTIVGAVVTFRDITDRLIVEKMKNEFVSVVSHELRTPLTSIRGSLGLLFSGKLGELSPKAYRMLEIAVNNTDRLVRLINDILDLERIESGKVELLKQTCNVADLMKAAAEVMQTMAERVRVNLSVSTVPETIPQLWADSDRLLQILTNLLSNAIKFSRPGNTVWLTAEIQELSCQCSISRKSIPSLNSQSLLDKKAVLLTKNIDAPTFSPNLGERAILFKVKDQGRGIPTEQLEKVFGRFQQVDASDFRVKGGTGLGLAICRSIVLAHGGQIWVESTLEKGSTFYVMIPIIQEESN
ncbi:MAG: PAS domain S-box protein [Potamolinea sp.]